MSSRSKLTLALAVVMLAAATLLHVATCEWTTAGPERDGDRLLSLRQAQASEDDVIQLRILEEAYPRYVAEWEKARESRERTRRLGIDEPNLAAFEDYDVSTREQHMLITETKIKLLRLSVRRFFGLYARAGTRRDAALTIGVLAPIALLIASLGFLLFRVRAPNPRPA